MNDQPLAANRIEFYFNCGCLLRQLIEDNDGTHEVEACPKHTVGYVEYFGRRIVDEFFNHASRQH